MTDELGFDLARDLLSLAPSSSPLPSLSPPTRLLPTRDETTKDTTTGAKFLESLGLSVDETLARAHAAGRFPRPVTPEFYAWKIRLAVERGKVKPYPVRTACISGSHTPTIKVWDGFVLLVRCKWLYAPGVPTTFSREFAAPWCGVTVRHARDGITALKRAGYMLPVGKHGRSTLWLPKRHA